MTITVASDAAGFVIGSNVTVTCSSDSGNADRIEWRSREGQVLVSGDSVQQLDLVFNPVNDSLHNSNITCFVTRDEGRANQTVSNQTLPLFVRGGCAQYDVCMLTGSTPCCLQCPLTPSLLQSTALAAIWQGQSSP